MTEREPGRVSEVGNPTERTLALLQKSEATALKRKQIIRHKLLPGGGMLLFFLGNAAVGPAPVPSLFLAGFFGFAVAVQLRRFLAVNGEYRGLQEDLENHAD